MTLFSHSRLSTYDNCPYQYRCHYLDRIRVKEETVEAFLGNRVHEVLEKLYEDVTHTRVPSLKDLLGFFEERWEERWHEQVRVVKQRYTPEDYYRMGRKYLSMYHQRYHPFDRDTTVALEESLSFPLDGDGEHGIRGIVDRIALAPDGAFEVHDYKTGARLPSQEALDRDRQLGFYQLGVTARWPEAEEVRLIWHYLAHDVEMTSHRSPGELEALKEETLKLIREIESAEDFPPRKSGLCGWCLYRSLCPLFAHETWVGGLDEKQFDEDDGVQLADRFGDLKEREKAVREEIASLREDILAYAEQQCVEVIVGHDSRVKIIRYTEQAYPGKKDPRRENLEKILKEAGVWEEVSSLDGRALVEAVRGSGWADELVERVMEFEETKTEKQVRITGEKD